MTFLQDFKSLEQLLEAHPGLLLNAEFASDQSLYWVMMAMHPSHLFKMEIFEKLTTKYGKADTIHGIATLLKHGKGKNAKVLQIGDVILKYGRSEYNGWSPEEDPAFQCRVKTCVDLARRITKQAANSMHQSPLSIVEQAAQHHFKVARNSGLWQKVQGNFSLLANQLGATIRIADNLRFEDTKVISEGYVITEKFSAYQAKNTIPSPHKTIAPEDMGEKRKVAGSIHVGYGLFKGSVSAITKLPFSDLYLASLIIHEASHKFCFTKDHAYVHEGSKYDDLSDVLRVQTADSYAFFAISVFHGALIENRENKALYT
jgi:hypothetical protein